MIRHVGILCPCTIPMQSLVIFLKVKSPIIKRIKMLFKNCFIDHHTTITSCTNRNQPKCNHSFMSTCNLQLFATRFGNICNYKTKFQLFWSFHNYDATIKIFILLVGSILHLFSSINRLICPISRSSHQISYILKVFYNDIHVYFNVCIKIIYIYNSYNESQN